MLSPAIWLEHFYDGNWFGIAYPLHLFFPLDLYFPPLLEKELDNLLPQGSTLPFQYVAIYIFTNQQKLQNHHLSRRFTVETFGACITYFLAPLGLVSCVIFNTQTPMISYILLGSNVLKSSLLQFYRSLCGSWYLSPQFLLCFLALIQQSHQESRYLSPASFQYRSLRTSSRPCRTIPKAWRAWMQLSSLML